MSKNQVKMEKDKPASKPATKAAGSKSSGNSGTTGSNGSNGNNGSSGSSESETGTNADNGGAASGNGGSSGGSGSTAGGGANNKNANAKNAPGNSKSGNPVETATSVAHGEATTAIKGSAATAVSGLTAVAQAKFRSDLQDIMFGFGDTWPSNKDTLALVEIMVKQYIEDVCLEARTVAELKGKLDVECFTFPVRKDVRKFKRLHQLLESNEDFKRVKSLTEIQQEMR
jgi:hypothetical protein